MDRSLELLNSLSIGTKPIIVGCSGGIDSMCLLNLLKENNYVVVCAHVNHNIRPVSKDEYIFLKNYCETRKIIFEGLELPENLQENESFYRKKRYSFYKDLAQKYDTPYIMTAHHGDDLIETILMRIARGSHLLGYAGFQTVYEEGKYIFVKPLIFYTKNELEDYNSKHDIPHVTDESNEEDTYTRNRYRHNIIPFLKNENPKVHLKYLQYSRELREADRYIASVVKAKKETYYINGILYLQDFQKEDDYIKRRILEIIFKEIYKDDVDKLKVFHTQNLLKRLSESGNFSLDLPLGITANREYNILKIEKRETPTKYKIKLEGKVTIPDGSTIEIIESSEDHSNYTTRLNSRELNLPLYIRTKETGDRMSIKNMTGSKKISDIFIDDKLSPTKREDYPILVDAKNEIIWLPGLRKSKFDNENPEKYDIILKYTKGKENN